MGLFLLNVLLALVWASLTGEFTQENVAVGFLLGFLLTGLFRRSLMPHSSYHSKVYQLFYFVGYFLWQLFLSNLEVAWEVITPKLYMTPAIVAIPLDVKTDLEITILANLITLTPGTLSLEVSEDRKTLYVHAMYVDQKNVESFRRSIKNGFERRVKELFE